jgi:hypothetical protein
MLWQWVAGQRRKAQKPLEPRVLWRNCSTSSDTAKTCVAVDGKTRTSRFLRHHARAVRQNDRPSAPVRSHVDTLRASSLTLRRLAAVRSRSSSSSSAPWSASFLPPAKRRRLETAAARSASLTAARAARSLPPTRTATWPAAPVSLAWRSPSCAAPQPLPQRERRVQRVASPASLPHAEPLARWPRCAPTRRAELASWHLTT